MSDQGYAQHSINSLIISHIPAHQLGDAGWEYSLTRPGDDALATAKKSFRDQSQAFTVSTADFVDIPTLAITWPQRAWAASAQWHQ